MSYISVTNIKISNPVSRPSDPIRLTVNFEALRPLTCTLTWKAIYVGNPDNADFEQVLDTVEMEGAEQGRAEFDWELDAPDYNKLSSEFDIFDTSVIMVLVYAAGNEFFRCSYLTTHAYTNEKYEEEPPESVKWDEIERRVNAKKPIIAATEVDWKNIDTSN